MESFLFKQNAAYPTRDRGLRAIRNMQKTLAFTIGIFGLDLTDYKFRVEMYEENHNFYNETRTQWKQYLLKLFINKVLYYFKHSWNGSKLW